MIQLMRRSQRQFLLQPLIGRRNGNWNHMRRLHGESFFLSSRRCVFNFPAVYTLYFLGTELWGEHAIGILNYFHQLEVQSKTVDEGGQRTKFICFTPLWKLGVCFCMGFGRQQDWCKMLPRCGFVDVPYHKSLSYMFGSCKNCLVFMLSQNGLFHR